jgi:hypothetical protein
MASSLRGIVNEEFKMMGLSLRGDAMAELPTQLPLFIISSTNLRPQLRLPQNL